MRNDTVYNIIPKELYNPLTDRVTSTEQVYDYIENQSQEDLNIKIASNFIAMTKIPVIEFWGDLTCTTPINGNEGADYYIRFNKTIKDNLEWNAKDSFNIGNTSYREINQNEQLLKIYQDPYDYHISIAVGTNDDYSDIPFSKGTILTIKNNYQLKGLPTRYYEDGTYDTPAK